MATFLKSAIEREVRDSAGKPLVVRLTPEGVYTKLKGTRTWYGPIGYGALFVRGAEMKALAEMKPRKSRVKRGIL